MYVLSLFIVFKYGLHSDILSIYFDILKINT
jgi:hypothetical protein